MPMTTGDPYGAASQTNGTTYWPSHGQISPAAPGAMPDLAGPPGLRVWFYRPAHGRDDTGGGLSACHEQATVIGVVPFDSMRGPQPPQPMPASMRIARPTTDAPAMWLVRDTMPYSCVVYLVPADRPTIDGIADLAGVRFGGNFAYSPDPLFTRLAGTICAVPVHDQLPGGIR
jgi:hypothetical protein